ncbi:nitrate/nitrite transporter NrtS [Candidatus Omnitrophota bacterium]
MVSLVVGTTLVLINQFDAIFYGPFTKTNLIQIIITYLVPYSVATYCSAMQAIHDEK